MKIKDNIASFGHLIFIASLFTLTISISYFLAFSVRFEFNISDHHWQVLLQTLPYLILIKLCSAYYLGLFKGWMGYAGMSDFVDILKYNTLGSLVFAMFLVLSWRMFGFSRSVVLIDWLLNLLFTGGMRFLRRFIREIKEHFQHKKNIDDKKHVLIVGAGDAGMMILREMKTNSRMEYNVVGFIDDNESKIGKKIIGVSILGNHKDIPEIVAHNRVDEVIIALPSASSSRLKSIIDTCTKTGVKLKTTPPASSLINGTVHFYQVRDIAIEDLLGRESIALDHKGIQEELKSKKVLVTGAGGSIGSELAWQITQYGVKQIILYERGESELHDIELKVRKVANKGVVVPVVGDILDTQRLSEVMEKYKPDMVYHAAAYKHVPLMEFNSIEAVRNNLIGSVNVAKTAIKYGVKKFILVSTDKAVNPTSVMGATKRASELVLKTMGNASTEFIAVRFGNVLNSRGSVVPLFKKQVAEGGPVTVTHPFIIRYFMSIPEASQLILQASAIGKGGDLFLLDMGDPVKIVDLAENIIKLYDKKPYKDIEIKFTGLRPGEKLYEELFNAWEELLPTSHKKIMRVSTVSLSAEFVKSAIEELEASLQARDKENVVRGLKKIVPSFKTSYQLICDDMGENIGKGLELNIKSCGREFKAKVTGVENKDSIHVALLSSTGGTRLEDLKGGIEVTFYHPSKKKIVRFCSSIVGQNFSDPSLFALSYPTHFEEREDLRVYSDQACKKNMAIA